MARLTAISIVESTIFIEDKRTFYSRFDSHSVIGVGLNSAGIDSNLFWCCTVCIIHADPRRGRIGADHSASRRARCEEDTAEGNRVGLL